MTTTVSCINCRKDQGVFMHFADLDVVYCDKCRPLKIVHCHICKRMIGKFLYVFERGFYICMECSEKEHECQICSEEYCKLVKTVCNHEFCNSCLMTWLVKSNHCPICRKKIADGRVTQPDDDE